jgi:2-polyprenyl-6-methoxyphenol hydroxylase-like FAD-dependent oxidoreductase
MRLQPISIAAFVLKKHAFPIRPSRRVVPRAFASDATNMSKSNAAAQAEGAIIVGGGIAGLAMAAALRNIAGVSNIKLLEASSENEFTNIRAGAAAQLGPNGLRALQFITSGDIVQKVIDMGGVLQGNVMMMPGGQSMVIPDTTQSDTGIPQVLVRWGMLRSVLAEQLPQGMILTGAESNVAGYKVSTQNDSEVSLIDATGNPLDMPSTPLIIGADGVKSTFRALVRKCTTNLAEDFDAAGGEDVTYGGRINVKAVVNKSLSEEYKSGHTYAAFAPDGSVAIFAGPAGDGLTYWAISIADSNDVTFLDDIPKGSDEKPEKKNLKEMLLAKLNTLNSDPYIKSVIDLIEQTPTDDVYFQKSQEAKGLGTHPLHSEDGRIVLAGDAAHAFSASYGQAANFALEDAATLAACIRDSENLKDALQDYSKMRLDRCIEMQARSAERAAKAMRGEQAEDVSKWIFQWEIA